MEPFVQRVRDHPRINGVLFGGEEHLISLYADDVMVMLDDPRESQKS